MRKLYPAPCTPAAPTLSASGPTMSHDGSEIPVRMGKRRDALSSPDMSVPNIKRMEVSEIWGCGWRNRIAANKFAVSMRLNRAINGETHALRGSLHNFPIQRQHRLVCVLHSERGISLAQNAPRELSFTRQAYEHNVSLPERPIDKSLLSFRVGDDFCVELVVQIEVAREAGGDRESSRWDDKSGYDQGERTRGVKDRGEAGGWLQ